MLGKIKNNIKGWVAYVIIGIITIPFALFGINQYFFGGHASAVAEVDDIEISRHEFFNEYNSRRSLILQQNPNIASSEDFDLALRQGVLEDIISRTLLGKFSKEMMVKVTPAELKRSIEGSEYFHDENGIFSFDVYERVVRRFGFTTNQYEQVHLSELERNQILNHVVETAFLLPWEISRWRDLGEQVRDVAVLSLPYRQFVDDSPIEDSVLLALYDQDQERFRQSERVKVDYIEISPNDIAEGVEVSERLLEDYYQNNIRRFSREEERRAQHILVRELALAEKLVDELNGGANFAELVREYSVDTGSKSSGGDLGFFGKGVMVPEFEEAVFALEVDEVSTPVETSFGFHIIKVNAINAGGEQPFDTVRQEIFDILSLEMAEGRFFDLLEELSNVAYEENLEAAARLAETSVKTSGFITTDDVSLEQVFIDTAFSPVVLEDGDTSEAIELSNEKYVIMRLNERMPERIQDFEEVRELLDLEYRFTLAGEKARAIAAEIVALLQEDDRATANALVSKHVLTWQPNLTLTRQSSIAEIDDQILNDVFTMSKPVNGESVFQVIDGLNKTTVVELSAVRVPEGQPNEQTSLEITDAIGAVMRSEILRNVLEDLQSKSDIDIYPDRLFR